MNREELAWAAGFPTTGARASCQPKEPTVGQARYIIGDVFDTLATLPDDSVDLAFSSPPFLALRSYLPADHPDKGKEIGSEATPADFLDTLLDVVEACDRVLAPHGSLCFELGDTFAGSGGGAGGDYNEGGLRDGQEKFKGSQSRSGWHRLGARGEQDDQPPNYRKDGTSTDSGSPGGGYGWPLPKSLCGIPTLFAWSLAYGRNLLRPERETPRWRIRNVVVWARPNPPVGALGDKFRPATSYLTVACKSDKRWFDLDAVRSPFVGDGQSWGTPDAEHARHTNSRKHLEAKSKERRLATTMNTHAGAPPLDYWEIPTQPYPGAHYATFPPALCVKPIKAMCPSKVCRVCGEPSRRITDVSYHHGEDARGVKAQGFGGTFTGDARRASADGANSMHNFAHGRAIKDVQTLGWTDCGHNDWRNGVVLDPFAGSGTTLSVSTGHGRDAIGIDIDQRNAELALERVGPLFLSVEHLNAAAAVLPGENQE